MPKRRRKQVVVNTTPELPYPKVRVEWIDILSDSGWATDKEFDKMNLSYPVNEGWLYSKDKDSIKLFASNSCSDMSSSFPVFIIFLSMYSPAAFPLFASAFTAEENDPFFKAASRSLASSAICPS